MKSMFFIKIIRFISFLIALPSIILLAPFSLFVFIKIKGFYEKLKNEYFSKDFYDLHTDLSASEVEYAANAIDSRGFPTKYGFIGELLKLNVDKKIDLTLTDNKLTIKRKKLEDLPVFLRENTYEEMFERWKLWALDPKRKSFILRGNYVLKVSLWTLFALHFIITIFSIIPFLFITGFSIPIITLFLTYFGISYSLFYSFVGTVLISSIVISSFLFLIYFSVARNKKIVEYSHKGIIEQGEKSIILNLIFNKLIDGRFDEEDNLNYFLMYGEYGSIAIASHAAKKLDVEKIKIFVENYR